MSRLPLKHTHIDYNPHVLHDEDIPDPKDYTEDMSHTAYLIDVIEELRKEVKDLTFIMRHLQEENDLLYNQLFPDRKRNKLDY